MNQTSKIIGLFLVFVIVVGSLGYLVTKWNIENKEIRLRNQITAHVDKSKSHYTKMKEIIFGSVQVADKYDDSFQKIYPKLISGRYNNGNGQLMQWVQESNPDYSTELLSKVQRAIESQRESFHQNQVQLLDVKRQHDNLLDSKPLGTWFLGDIEHIEVPIIISNETKNTFDSGIEESNQKLF